MSGVFFIGENQREAIETAISEARAKPKPWSAMQAIVQDEFTPKLMLKDRKADVERVLAEYPSHHVQLGTYRCAVSFEQQPAGLFKHLSVSSARKGKLPGPEVMKMACEAFGFSKKVCEAIGGGKALLGERTPFNAWLEEFEPGHMAINVVEPENELQ